MEIDSVNTVPIEGPQVEQTSVPGVGGAVDSQDGDHVAGNAGSTARPVDGRFRPGNTLGRKFTTGNDAARKHGLYAAATARGDVPVDLQQSIAEFRSGIISDLGGSSELTTIVGGYIRRLCDVEVALRLLQNDLVTRGLFTPKGRVRSTYQRLLETIGTWDRLAQRLGTERKARPLTFADAVRAATPDREPS